jgi:hypothetical protein
MDRAAPQSGGAAQSFGGRLRKVLVFTTLVELATGVALIAVPGIVVRLLLGGELAGPGVATARCFGVALVALAFACWPGGTRVEGGRAPFQAMLIYNALIASYLAWLGTAHSMKGLLLWPAVALHAAVALLLVWTRRPSRIGTTV